MFIGDSISINQWQSLLCMLHAAVPTTSGIITQDLHNHTVSTVTFKHYKVSVMLFRSFYLVDVDKETIGRVLKLNSVRNGNLWKEIDVLIFNTWHWWHRRGLKQQWEYVQVDGKIRKDIDRTVAFRTALRTWAKWVDSDVDTNRTKTTPFKGSIYPTGLPLAGYAVKEVIRNIKKPVHLLDITMLSQLRKDAHPSTYNGFNSMDCCRPHRAKHDALHNQYLGYNVKCNSSIVDLQKLNKGKWTPPYSNRATQPTMKKAFPWSLCKALVKP
ncbi:hypothetical protein J1N35_036114 [Gossypium stocksii]|uniref:Trichome birefringence-like C-terminal domain-containing protein n=1 Tax=Gossypium stocksii TaxID=47602 RepID=A0A9D3UHU6_9ROSI|nr:hypothetical protein J1N35_036114 [Gossypium stocksii]